MYIDSKQKLNEVVSKFRGEFNRRVMLNEPSEHIPFQSAHQLFAKIFHYETQAALLAALPIELVNNKELNIEASYDYYKTDLPRDSFDLNSSMRWDGLYYKVRKIIQEHLPQFDLAPQEALDEFIKNTAPTIHNVNTDKYIICETLDKIFNHYVDQKQQDLALEFFNLANKHGMHKGDWRCGISQQDSCYKTIKTGDFELFSHIVKKHYFETTDDKTKVLECIVLQSNPIPYIDKMLETGIPLMNLFKAIINSAHNMKWVKLQKMLETFKNKGGDLHQKFAHRDVLISQAIYHSFSNREWEPITSRLISIGEDVQLAFHALCNMTNDYERINSFEKIKFLVEKGVDPTKTRPKMMERPKQKSGRRALSYDWGLRSYYAPLDAFRYLELNKPEHLKIAMYYLQECGVKPAADVLALKIQSAIGVKEDLWGDESEEEMTRRFTIKTELLDHMQEHELIRQISERRVWELCIQAFYQGDGVTPLFFIERFDINAVFKEFSPSNKLSKMSENTPLKELIPLLFKSAHSTQPRRQGLSSGLLMFLTSEVIEPFAKSEQDKALVCDIKNNVYRGSGYCIDFN